MIRTASKVAECFLYHRLLNNFPVSHWVEINYEGTFLFIFWICIFARYIFPQFYCCGSKNESFIKNLVKLHTHKINASSQFIWANCVLLFKGRLVDQQHYRRDASPTMFSHVYIIFFTNDYVKKVNIFKDNPVFWSISTSFLKLKIPTQTSF